MINISNQDIENAKRIVYEFLAQKGIDPLRVDTTPLIHKVLNRMLSSK